MIVYFVAALESADRDVEILRRVIRVVHSRGHSVAKNWIEPQHFLFKDTDKASHLDWANNCRENEYLIGKSDVIIAEVSGYSTFGVGHQVAIAQQQGKPVLLLARSVPRFGAYTDGLGYGMTQREEYDLKNLEEKVEKFLCRFEAAEPPIVSSR